MCAALRVPVVVILAAIFHQYAGIARLFRLRHMLAKASTGMSG